MFGETASTQYIIDGEWTKKKMFCTHRFAQVKAYSHKCATISLINLNERNNNKKWWQTISINDYQMVNGGQPKTSLIYSNYLFKFWGIKIAHIHYTYCFASRQFYFYTNKQQEKKKNMFFMNDTYTYAE